MLKHSSYTKIAYLDLAFACYEYVLCFEVSMQDFPIMDMFQCQTYLNKPI
jgi:hypothetical protein